MASVPIDTAQGLRVLWVTTSAGRDGPGRVLSAILRHWPKTDAIAVRTLRATPESRTVVPAHVTVESVDMRGLWDARAFWRLLKLTRSWRPDIVHTQLSRADWIGRAVAARLGIPVVSTIHNLHARAYAADFTWPAARVGLTLDRLTRPLTDRFVAVSEAVGADLVGQGVPADRIVVIPNGLDLDRRPSDFFATSRQAIRRDWGIADGELVVGTVARLVPQKGIEFLVAAAREVIARNPRVRFVLIGDGPLAGQSREWIASAGLTARFQQIESVAEPMTLLPGMDIFALSSLWEGLPVALLEAMASGLPSVATRVAGNEEAIEDGRSGALVPPRDPAALANAIIDLASNPARRQAMGAAARARVEHAFDASAMAARYRQLYTDLLASRRA